FSYIHGCDCFPTRRSSDLAGCAADAALGFAPSGGCGRVGGKHGVGEQVVEVEAFGGAAAVEGARWGSRLLVEVMERDADNFFGVDRKSTRQNSSHVKI